MQDILNALLAHRYPVMLILAGIAIAVTAKKSQFRWALGFILFVIGAVWYLLLAMGLIAFGLQPGVSL